MDFTKAQATIAELLETCEIDVISSSYGSIVTSQPELIAQLGSTPKIVKGEAIYVIRTPYMLDKIGKKAGGLFIATLNPERRSHEFIKQWLGFMRQFVKTDVDGRKRKMRKITFPDAHILVYAVV